MMDSAYDAPQIKAHSRASGRVPIIDTNPRNKIKKAELKAEAKRRREANYALAEDRRYNERSTVDRDNGRIKDDFGARIVRVQGQGHAKVVTHLIFGIVVLTVEQLMRVIEWRSPIANAS